MKRKLKLALGAVAAYAFIVILLTAVESGAENATIHNIGDAIWYSIVTLTTVGYGDLSPVTSAGKILGSVLALCSIGILSAVISIFFHLIDEQFLPLARLYMNRDKQWYVFSCGNRDAMTLAGEFADEDCVLVVQGDKDSITGENKNTVCISEGIAGLRRLKDSDSGMTLFLMKEDPWENYCEGLEAAALSVDSYCMSDLMVGAFPDHLNQFGKAECMGRWYWQYHPLLKSEKCVVLIGCGRYGNAVLERALLTNVYDHGRTVEYHVFEDDAGFAFMHGELVHALTAGDPEEDSLVFHDEKWHESTDLLGRADRIILCRDDDSMNLDIYEKLSTWFGIKDKIHVRLSENIAGIPSFGEGDKILTREYVMKGALNRQALLMHGIYNRGSDNPVPWESLSYFLKQSNIAAADHLLVKIRYLLEDETITSITKENCSAAYEVYARTRESRGEIYQEMEHRRWMHFYLMHNWTYDPVRDNEKRHHPLMLPYKDLAPKEQKKDASAWEMLNELYS